jgi:Uma2 family endonuclease
MVEPARTDDGRFTYADLITWPEEERWELIEGIPYEMTPAPSQRHQEIVIELIMQFGVFLRDSPCRLYTAPFDVRLPKSMESGMTASTVVQPDLLVVCDREKLDGKGVVGSPTLVVEITSPSTAVKDLREKRSAYERAGVPEYWIISPTDKTVQVYTLNEQGQYGAPAVYTVEDQAPVGVLAGLVIDLARVFAAE